MGYNTGKTPQMKCPCLFGCPANCSIYVLVFTDYKKPDTNHFEFMNPIAVITDQFA